MVDGDASTTSLHDWAGLARWRADWLRGPATPRTTPPLVPARSMCWTYEAVRAAADLVDMRDAHGHFSLKSGHLVRWPPHKTLAINELRRAGRPRRYPLKVARWSGSEDSRLVAEGCHDWPPYTVKRNSVGMAIFGGKRSEINGMVQKRSRVCVTQRNAIH